MTKQRKQRSIMYTQQQRLLLETDWKNEVKRIVDATEPEHWAGILHDKDINDDGEPVEPHLHLMLYFKHARSPQSLAWEIEGKQGKREDAKTERLEFFKHPNNGYSYLVHQTENAKDKYQYPVEDVISNFNFPEKIAKITKQVERANSRKDNEIIQKFLDLLYEGDMTLEEIEEELTGSQYAKASNKLKAVAEKRQERLGKDFIANMIASQARKTSIYIFGKSRLGKTRLAKYYAKTLSADYFITGSSRDPFQQYQNQPIVIIDELRYNSFQYEDLLKILDPYNFEVMLPSRYFDKVLTAQKIIITSPFSPRELYDKIGFSLDDKDSFEQLQQRLETVILVEEETIYETYYNSKNKTYVKDETKSFPNPYKENKTEKTTTSDIFENLKNSITESENKNA